MVDWSARSSPAPKRPTKDAIFFGGVGELPTYARTRAEAMATIEARLRSSLEAGRRTLIGFDFGFGYPAGLAAALGLPPDALAVWDWLAGQIEDAPDGSNNRWDVARRINRAFDGLGPLWGCPSAEADDILPAKGKARHGHGLQETRQVEKAVRTAQSTLKLFTTGSVGSQILLGLPWLSRLRHVFGDDLVVWPQESGLTRPDAPIVLVEIYPSLIAKDGPLKMRAPGWLVDDPLYLIPDAVQVRALAEAFACLDRAGTLEALFRPENVSDACTREEGWILGVERAAS